MRSIDGVYRNPITRPIPNLDLLTFLFDSEWSSTLPGDILHADAEKPSINLNKAGLCRLFQEFAFGLRERLKVGANGHNKDVVVVFSTGQVAYPAIFYAIIAAGGVASLASASCTAFELARQVRQGGANVLISSPDVLHVAREAVQLISEKKITIVVLRTEPDYSLQLDEEGEDRELRSQAVQRRLEWERTTDPKQLEESLIALLYSAGTTSEPKGVMLSHRNFVSQVVSADRRREQTILEIFPSRSLAHLSPAHITAVNLYMINPAYRRGQIFWMRKYNWDDFLRHTKELKLTVMATVPSIWLRITKDPQVEDHFKTLRVAAGGSAPFNGKLQQAVNKKLSIETVSVAQVYGSSENTGALTAPIPGETDDTGSIGAVVPNSELRIVDEHGHDVDVGSPGEIICRGPSVTRGYFRNEESNKSSFRDGWYYSGDVAVERDGKFYIVDRLKDLIKYKGLQIAPAEIESVLNDHPDILESAVVPVPDPNEDMPSSGAMAQSEVPRAYVVPASGSSLTEQKVKAIITHTLAGYKQLRGGVVFVDELPKNMLGKLLRRELKSRALGEMQGNKRSRNLDQSE